MFVIASGGVPMEARTRGGGSIGEHYIKEEIVRVRVGG